MSKESWFVCRLERKTFYKIIRNSGDVLEIDIFHENQTVKGNEL
jgi:hypothetical protein